jgi:bifunctional DNA-binding transcriptional regulator/antitoxin component of YhaV-PrlF toxin-antitoxin module
MNFITTVDNFGRVVLPKAVRTLLGMEKRTPLRVEVIGDVVQISLAETPRSAVSKRRGRPVHAGDLPDDWNSGDAVHLMRSARMVS